ncbi:kinase-like protein [Daedalea quercina L-15889]|uniref:Kinase-like protein n=1 Tax=Daedalea quercina L-15889 TaxID=1314783 RepID=A0A165LEL0_9APHY|nr:kinase-like protein [Daedalea quercina L-15889]
MAPSLLDLFASKMFARLFRRIKLLCLPWSDSGSDALSASDLSSPIYTCEWTPDHIPVARLSVTAQAGSQRTSAESWISDLARETRPERPQGSETAPHRGKWRLRGRRKVPPAVSASMLDTDTRVNAPATSEALARASGSRIPIDSGVRGFPVASPSQLSDLDSIPSWSSMSRRENLEGRKRFIVRGVVGEGIFGKVFLVRDILQERDAAMKVIRVAGTRPACEYRCLITEIKILRMLGEDPQEFLLSPYMGCERREWLSPFGDLHILTKYYAGGTLEVYLGRLGLREVWLVTAELVLGLDWLHSKGYVHCDLKPANILVGGSGHCVISDFNSCKWLTQGEKLRRDAVDDVLITQYYAAPELIADAVDVEYDQSVDIWSLGVVVSELLTGKQLFGGDEYSSRKTIGQMRNDALAHMADAESPCSYLVHLARAILVEDPARRMSLEGIVDYPGFEHMWVTFAAIMPSCRHVADQILGASTGITFGKGGKEL